MLPQGITFEQFSAAFADATGAAIRTELKAQYGLDIPSSYSRSDTLKRAYTMLTTPAVATETAPAAPDATEPETAPAAPEPQGKQYLVRTTGVRSRMRAGRAWTHAWSTISEGDLTPEQWKALRADRMILIRERGV